MHMKDNAKVRGILCGTNYIQHLNFNQYFTLVKCQVKLPANMLKNCPGKTANKAVHKLHMKRRAKMLKYQASNSSKT